MIAHITLPVRDVLRAVDFFEATLNLTSIQRPSNVPVPTKWLRIGPGQELHLVQVEGYEPTPYDREFGRHIAIERPVAEFDDLKARLNQNGATLIDPLRPTPFPRFFFRDPDGHVFEVVARERVIED